MVGTVKDDLHDIGKEIFSGMAVASGFEVYDLGVDVADETFISNYNEIKPDIIGISGVLTGSIKNIKSLVDEFEKAGLRKLVKIIIGGSPITEDICKFIGADAFSSEVKQGIKICENWIKEKQESNGV